MEAMNYENLGGGAAAELFDRELEKILANIHDPNRPYKNKREITLKVTFAPNEDRDKVAVEIAVSSKAPGFKTFETIAYLGFDPRDRTKPRAYERGNPDQQTFPFMTPEPNTAPTIAATTTDERTSANA